VAFDPPEAIVGLGQNTKTGHADVAVGFGTSPNDGRISRLRDLFVGRQGHRAWLISKALQFGDVLYALGGGPCATCCSASSPDPDCDVDARVRIPCEAAAGLGMVI